MNEGAAQKYGNALASLSFFSVQFAIRELPDGLCPMMELSCVMLDN